jgi:hypothetical protein
MQRQSQFADAPFDANTTWVGVIEFPARDVGARAANILTMGGCLVIAVVPRVMKLMQQASA